MVPHSSTLAWKIPWAEEPGGLQSMGSRKVVHDWATSLSLFTFMHWRRKWQPTPVFLSGEFQGWQSLVGSHRVGHDWSDLAAAEKASSIILNEEKLNVILSCLYCKVENRPRMSALTASIQHGTKGSNQSCQARKMSPDWKGSKALFIHRCHDHLWRKSSGIYLKWKLLEW